jgi:hypothetical protein
MADINQAFQPIWGKIDFTNACNENELKAESAFKQGKNINIEPFQDTEHFHDKRYFQDTEHFQDTESFEVSGIRVVGGPCTANPSSMTPEMKKQCFPNETSNSNTIVLPVNITQELKKYSKMYIDATENVSDVQMKNENLNITNSMIKIHQEIFDITKESEKSRLPELLNNLNSLGVQRFINSNFRNTKASYAKELKFKIMGIASANKIELSDSNFEEIVRNYTK